MGNIVVLGLDGATFDVIKPWVQEGCLPNFATLLQRGVCGALRSTFPPMSPPAWNSFMTGMNPGKHGVFDFTERQPQHYASRFVNATSRQAAAFWRYLSAAGKRVAVLSVPFTYPPEAVNGIMISGMDAPGIAGQVDRSATYPAELCDELREKVGPYPMGPNLFAYTDPLEMQQAALRSMTRKIQAATYLYQREPWDCFVFVLGETDAICHRLWHTYDTASPLRRFHALPPHADQVLLSVYQKVDEMIGQFLEMISPETTLLVMSDHGHGGNGDTVVHLNRWLEEAGMLTCKRLHNGLKAAIETAKRLGLKVLPPHLKRLIYRLTNLPNTMESWARFGHIDWRRTLAYSEETPYYPSVWINLQGREPQGVVPEADYERVRTAIATRLTHWRNPWSAAPLVRRVYRREEVYSGPATLQAPDLLIDWHLDQGYSYLFRPSTGKKQPAVHKVTRQEATRVKSGDHRDDGILLACGPALQAPGELHDAALVDLAPTLLYLLDVPIPTTVDGQILTTLFRDHDRTMPPPRYEHSAAPDGTGARHDYSDQETQALKARLQALGYIE